MQSKPDRSGYVVKAANLGVDIVSAVASFDVLVVRATIQYDVALSRSFPRVGVVGHLVRIEMIGAVLNLSLPLQFEDNPIFFLLNGLDGDLLAALGGRCGGNC